MIELLTPFEGQIVSLHRKEHLDYIREPKNTAASDVDWLRLKESGADLSYPPVVTFSCSPAGQGELLLTHPGGEVTCHAVKDGQAEIGNLKIGATYRWQVCIDGACSEVRSFQTSDVPPRLLRVDGITNVRDFGGFSTADGKRIRQGLLYRTSEMDTHAEITDAGRATLAALGIRTDLDIRGCNDEHRAPVLDEAMTEWVNIPMVAYDKLFSSEAFIKAYGEGYALLADKARYPMIVHCWGGIDRTGCWLFILGGMLGVPEEQLFLDYEFSSFSRWGRRSRYSDQFRAFYDGLMTYGDTLQEACRRFMLAAGVTEAKMEQIQSILTEI